MRTGGSLHHWPFHDSLLPRTFVLRHLPARSTALVFKKSPRQSNSCSMHPLRFLGPLQPSHIQSRSRLDQTETPSLRVGSALEYTISLPGTQRLFLKDSSKASDSPNRTPDRPSEPSYRVENQPIILPCKSKPHIP